jgi:outer membrane lipoprotein-sorting protein
MNVRGVVSVGSWIAGCMGLVGAMALSQVALAVTPDDILKAADEIRNPSDSFAMKVRVETGGDISGFEVFTKGKDKTLVKTIAPPRDVGRDLLMLEENMWAYIPNLKRAVRVSLNQKLSGQAANGDIARMRWYGDYDAKVEKETPVLWILKLVAKKKGLTYERMRAFVEKKSMRPIKAEYLSSSDGLLKTAEFEEFKNIAGGVRPTLIKIRDGRSTEQSSIKILQMESGDFPPSLFQREALGKP